MLSNKKEYIKPELTSHGELKNITLGGDVGAGDSSNATQAEDYGGS